MVIAVPMAAAAIAAVRPGKLVPAPMITLAVLVGRAPPIVTAKSVATTAAAGLAAVAMGVICAVR